MTPFEASDYFVDANGLRLHCRVDGPADAPVLALVNPASHNLLCWEGVVDALALDHRVLRFDIRGTGKSSWGADSDFTFPHYAADLVGLLDTLAIERACVVGVAYGARTAARFAIDHPQRLSGLGLFDVALTPPVEQSGQRELAEQARALLREAGKTPPEAKKYWRFYTDREAARKAHTAHSVEPDTSEQLSGLKVPVLVACGRQDMNLAEAERIHRATAGSQFEVMEMTGHGSPFFRPTRFVELVRDLLARC